MDKDKNDDDFIQLNETFWVRPSLVSSYWQDEYSVKRCHIIVDGCRQDLAITLADLTKALRGPGGPGGVVLPAIPAGSDDESVLDDSRDGWYLKAGLTPNLAATWQLRLHTLDSPDYKVVAQYAPALGNVALGNVFPVYEGKCYPVRGE